MRTKATITTAMRTGFEVNALSCMLASVSGNGHLSPLEEDNRVGIWRSECPNYPGYLS